MTHTAALEAAAKAYHEEYSKHADLDAGIRAALRAFLQSVQPSEAVMDMLWSIHTENAAAREVFGEVRAQLLKELGDA